MLAKDVVIKVDANRSNFYRVQTNATLLYKVIEMFDFPLRKTYFDVLSEHGPAVAALCSKLKKVRGVEKIFINPYEVTVHMAGINEVTDEVRKIVKDFVYLAAQLEGVVENATKVRLRRSKVNSSQAIMDFNFEVTKRPFKFSKKYTDKNLKGLNANLQKFLKKLVAIAGVNGVEVSYYQIVIDYAPLFDIEKIIEEIMTAYVEFAGKA